MSIFQEMMLAWMVNLYELPVSSYCSLSAIEGVPGCCGMEVGTSSTAWMQLCPQLCSWILQDRTPLVRQEMLSQKSLDQQKLSGVALHPGSGYRSQVRKGSENTDLNVEKVHHSLVCRQTRHTSCKTYKTSLKNCQQDKDSKNCKKKTIQEKNVCIKQFLC